MLKVWIAGSAGQIGTAINRVLDPMEMEVFNTDKNELDITQTDEVLRFGCPVRAGAGACLSRQCARRTESEHCRK